MVEQKMNMPLPGQMPMGMPMNMPLPGQMPQMPTKEDLDPEAAEKFYKANKKNIDKFKAEAMKASKKFIGMSVLPPRKDKKELIDIMLLTDDSHLKIHEKFKFREDMMKKLQEVAAKVDKNIIPDVVILEELWQNCYDGKYDLVQLISAGHHIFDKGMLAAIKISLVHKSMVLKKFEKYIVSYVLAGSLVQGRATEKSDIDVCIIIDDTDVKKMTRVELREKLRAIILGMGTEAGMITGIKNKINIQVWILTDFWDGVKEANPVYFTFLRDGIPFFDKGTFMPLKMLLKMGKVKPSQESIDLHMNSGEQMLKRMQFKINEMGMEDMFWATLNPSQAALMLYGLPPPTPKETPELLRDIFVKKEKLLEDEYVKILEKIIKTRKDMEHNPKLDLSGKELDDLMKGARKYLERIKKLFEQIQQENEKDSVAKVYEDVLDSMRDALKLDGIENIKDEDVEMKFKNNLITTGKISQKALRIFKELSKAKADYEKNKLTKAEVEKVKREVPQLMRAIMDYVNRARGKEIAKTKIRIKHGDKFAEVTLLGDKAFIVDDIDAKTKEIKVAKINKDGSISGEKKATLAELEKALVDMKIPEKVFIKQPIFDDLKKRYGSESEVLITF
ncbi:hypothetical protein HN592_04020 [Candidatus Woesearchaeota archaeon]|jgi:uncharacterized protein (UPF0332 family)/predicted nucleotidyltransferase|nr:hypothetical protein [Candidatus Woesearchaeota archaeon]MBT4368378.1 hypothetical protein [Candidatus Woesearchaeota archaeon]MBT4712867.1 hypothetical protein [Candidatus Woesearchaeota archaeon]MBT6639779.1 hypothetical protein [Candidatus Woesearchaeota archaeon]MBT7133951.1 hypothetical protein [Candidatus Woesearchaeota archaeon]